MKRKNNLYQQVCSIENIQLADIKAQKGKAKQYGVIVHNNNKESNLLQLQDMLLNKATK